MKSIATSILLFVVGLASAQTFTTVATGLRTPFGLDFDASRPFLPGLILTETGTGSNDGAISLVKPDGSLQPIVAGLASIVNPVEMDIIGPWRTFSKPGDATNLYAMQPLAGGVLKFKIAGATLPLAGADCDTTIVADFVYMNEPDTLPDSDPYSAAFDAAGNLYVCDAAYNGIVKVDAVTGERTTFAFFPPSANPLPSPPFPPVIDAVPTRIVAKPGGGFYVSLPTDGQLPHRLGPSRTSKAGRRVL